MGMRIWCPHTFGHIIYVLASEKVVLSIPFEPFRMNTQQKKNHPANYQSLLPSQSSHYYLHFKDFLLFSAQNQKHKWSGRIRQLLHLHLMRCRSPRSGSSAILEMHHYNGYQFSFSILACTLSRVYPALDPKLAGTGCSFLVTSNA